MLIDQNFITEVRRYVAQGLISERTKGDLSIFNYTNDCTFSREWNQYTETCRGLIWDNKNEVVVARPWKKFFNLGEREETFLANIPAGAFTSMWKEDGSLGILFQHDGEFFVSTRGAFDSPQAQWATKWARENLRLNFVNEHYTYLFEIIYPENRIVVDYKGESKLVLLGCVSKKTGEEKSYLDLNIEKDYLQCELAKIEPYSSVSEVVKVSNELDSNREGFVLTFESGLKVKIKGSEYLRVAKLLSQLSPIAIWENFKTNGEVSTEHFKQIPEEFRDYAEKLKAELDRRYKDVYDKMRESFDFLNLTEKDIELDRKGVAEKILRHNNKADAGLLFSLMSISQIAFRRDDPKKAWADFLKEFHSLDYTAKDLVKEKKSVDQFVKKTYDPDNASVMFNLIGIHKSILDRIRPTGNDMGTDFDDERLKRVQAEIG